MAHRKPLRLLSAFSVFLAFAAAAACSDNPITIAIFDGGDDAGQGDGAVIDASSSDAGSDGSIPADSSPVDTGVDARLKDTTPPAQITTLTATTTSLTSITLSWTAVGDDGLSGTATAYELRQSLAPITSLTEFAVAAVVASPPAPAVAGTVQTKLVTGLNPGTAYHYAIRAHDEVPNQGDISPDATATTLVRAQLLVSEAAVSNTALLGYDFVELVAVTDGRVDGLVVKEGTTTLYTFGALTVAAGDLIVVHSMGTPCPTGCAQEDISGLKTSSTEPFAVATAWDVYAVPTSPGLTASDNVLTIFDGATTVDALAISNRDSDAAMASMTAFALLNTAAAWTFGVPPVDTMTDCATQKDAVSIATGVTACGGQPGYGAGVSIQRNGTTDTNSRKDFFMAPQTMGLANTGNIAPTVNSAVPTDATTVVVTFSEDIAALSVTATAFTNAALGVPTATLSDVNQATLVYATSQVAGQSYTIAVDATVTDLQGTPLVASSPAVCGYAPTAALIIINEVAPNISYPTSLAADLIELRVVTGGATAGTTVRVNPTTTAVSGSLLATVTNACLPAGELIVVHLHPANAPGPAPASELTGKDQYLAATYAANYDTAWDIVSSNTTDISGTTELVLTVVGPPPAVGAATLLDAVAFVSGATTGATFKTALGVIQTATQWTPACTASPCDDTSVPNNAVSVSASYAGVGTAPTTPTVGRNTAGTDTNTATDWVVGPSTLGLSN